MTERFPDIEIYLMKPDPQAVRQWLEQSLSGQVEELTSGAGHRHWRVTQAARVMDIFLNENAEKNFASLWIKQNDTPWNNDLDCARSAHQALGCEIRCSDSGWQESEGENGDGGWIKLIRGEEKPLRW